jgi:hypothetical protein
MCGVAARSLQQLLGLNSPTEPLHARPGHETKHLLQIVLQIEELVPF